MPDTENKRLAILDELDDYNTAPEADSLMLGILKEQEGEHRKLGGERESLEHPATQAADDTIPGEAAKEADDRYLPLNTSIQEMHKELNGKFENRFSGLEHSIQSLANTMSQGQQRQQPQQEQYDPDMPITAQHMTVLAQRQEQTYQMGLQAYKTNIATRAHLEYMRFKNTHPDFQFDPAQIDFAVESMARDGKLQELAGANWRGQFEQMYAPQRDSRYDTQQKEVERLTKELEALKKSAARSAPSPLPVSPSTGRSSRGPAAISTPLQSSNDDGILGLKSFRQKGNFKGFAKDLKSMMKREA